MSSGREGRVWAGGEGRAPGRGHSWGRGVRGQKHGGRGFVGAGLGGGRLQRGQRVRKNSTGHTRSKPLPPEPQGPAGLTAWAAGGGVGGAREGEAVREAWVLKPGPCCSHRKGSQRSSLPEPVRRGQRGSETGEPAHTFPVSQASSVSMHPQNGLPLRAGGWGEELKPLRSPPPGNEWVNG